MGISRSGIWKGLLLLAVGLSVVGPASAQKRGKRASGTLGPGTATQDPMRQRALKALFYDAASAQAQEKYDEALKLYREIVSLDTAHAAAHFAIGEILGERQQFVQALPYAQKCYRLDRANHYYPILLSAIYLGLRQGEKAVAVLDEATKRFPDVLDLNFRLADAYLLTQKYEEALTLYDTLEQRTGLAYELALQKYRVFLGTRQFERGIREMKRYIERSPDEPRHYLYLYDLQANAEQFDSAMVTLERLRAIDPNNDQASFILADFYLKRHQTDKAAEIMNQALSNPLISLQAKLQVMGNLMARYGDPFERARIRGYFARVEQTHPGSGGVLVLKAQMKQFDNQPDSARALYVEALERDDANLQGWTSLLNLDLQQQKWSELREHGEKALAVFPGNLQFLFYKGVACYQLKDYAATRASLESALALEPSDPGLQVQLHTLLGDTYHYLDEHIKSDASYEKALSLDPTNALALNNYAYFLSVRKVKLDRAREMISRVIRDPVHSTNSSYQDTYGWVLYQLGDYKEALVWIQRAYEQDQNPEVTEHLGDVKFMLGDTDSAVRLWQDALGKLKPGDIAYPRVEVKVKTRKL